MNALANLFYLVFPLAYADWWSRSGTKNEEGAKGLFFIEKESISFSVVWVNDYATLHASEAE